MNRFLIACGGTGGHLAPGIAVAEELQARGHSSTLLISTKQIDSRLCRKYGHFDFRRMPGAGFSIRPIRFARFVASQARAVAFARATINEERPDFVLGFGGFTTAAVAVAARTAGVPVALHEANRVPGRAIKLAGAMARRVYLPPGVQRPGLGAAVIRHCGMPVRRELTRQSRARACVNFGLDPKRRVLVVLGGSQGARALNDWGASAAATLAHEGVQMICVTGPGNRAGSTVEGQAGDGGTVRSIFMPFCDDMAGLLSCATLVVSRAGAGTIAELIRMRVPALLVPFPHAADNHQEANARFFEQQGGGFTVAQTFIGDLTRETIEVIFNDWLLQQFANNLQRMDRTDPLDFVADDLERLLREPGVAGLRTAVAS
ncbi:MAG: UDP-N-acetylglucosamine--N-acetylmuramyl-(pentapeptide) pyrophosphoryl-undecaprenol N-acetylglucosamine transferase [Opitutaceae bacterium]